MRDMKGQERRCVTGAGHAASARNDRMGKWILEVPTHSTFTSSAMMLEVADVDNDLEADNVLGRWMEVDDVEKDLGPGGVRSGSIFANKRHALGLRNPLRRRVTILRLSTPHSKDIKCRGRWRWRI